MPYETLFNYTLHRKKNDRNREVFFPVFLNIFRKRITEDHLYSGATMICIYNHKKRGQSLKVCLLLLLLFIVCSHRWVAPWMIVTNIILQPFPGSPSHISWSWSQTWDPCAWKWGQLSFKYWFRCPPDRSLSSCQPAWATADSNRSKGDGEVQEDDEFWSALLNGTAADGWTPPQASGMATDWDRSLCRRDKLFTWKGVSAVVVQTVSHSQQFSVPCNCAAGNYISGYLLICVKKNRIKVTEVRRYYFTSH